MQLWLLDPVPGWIPANNAIRRLLQAPKHQLADPALAARLLNLSETSLVGTAGAHMIGPLFESLVTLGVRVMAQAAEARVSHLRLTGGDREIDLIVEGPRSRCSGPDRDVPAGGGWNVQGTRPGDHFSPTALLMR